MYDLNPLPDAFDTARKALVQLDDGYTSIRDAIGTLYCNMPGIDAGCYYRVMPHLVEIRNAVNHLTRSLDDELIEHGH